MHNGAMLIGLNGVVIKSHGSTDGLGFSNAIKVAISLIENKINDKIIAEIKSNETAINSAINNNNSAPKNSENN
jgi:glycerol-3-phosphate acyltransferase PlsX